MKEGSKTEITKHRRFSWRRNLPFSHPFFGPVRRVFPRF
jgi:hypothetical protein